VEVRVCYDETLEHPSVRLHPYVPIHEGQSGHVDFKVEPERIPIVLEDFIGHADQRAIQTFYEFLRWINGQASQLETCDCAFRGPAPHQDELSQRPLRADGRVFVMFRDLTLNCDDDRTHWLCDRLMRELDAIDPEVTEADGFVAFTFNFALHVALAASAQDDGSRMCSLRAPGLGRHVMLTFVAYGDDEAQTFDRLDWVFRCIDSACRRVSDQIQSAVSSGVWPLAEPTQAPE